MALIYKKRYLGYRIDMPQKLIWARLAVKRVIFDFFIKNSKDLFSTGAEALFYE